MSDTLTRNDPKVGDPQLDGGHDTFSHIVVPADKVTEALILGIAVEALCGKKWVPTKDPKKHPVCPDCNAILADITLGHWGYEARDGT